MAGLAALAIPDQETARYTLVLILIAAYVKVSYWIGRQAPEAPRLAYRDFCQLNAQQMSGWVIGSMFLAGTALVVLTYFVAAKPDWLGACLCFGLGVFLVYRSVLVARIKWSLQHQ